LRKRSLVKGSGRIQPIGVLQRANIHQANQPARPQFMLLMRERGRQAAFDLPLGHDLIKQLAFEALFRGQSIPDLIGKIVSQVMERGLVGEMRLPPAPEAAMTAFAKSWRRARPFR
jgi:hypothetical protein